VSPRTLVRLEGAVYSVPSRWAGLDLVVRIGAATVTIVGRDGSRILHPRKRFGQWSIDYRHYLAELTRKPQAVRQVLPDLLRDLGDPFPAIWDQQALRIWEVLLATAGSAIRLRLGEMERAREPRRAVARAAARAPMLFECLPHRPPVLRGRFHDDLVHLVLDQPIGQAA
jgi:hypothetical protein